jgi:hypothetical protein
LLACLEGTLLLLSDKHSEEENRIDPLGEVPVELVVVMSSDVFRSPDNYGDARRPTARPVAPTCRRQPDHSRRDPSPERHSSLLVSIDIPTPSSAPVMTERACPFFFFFFLASISARNFGFGTNCPEPPPAARRHEATLRQSRNLSSTFQLSKGCGDCRGPVGASSMPDKLARRLRSRFISFF